MRQAADHHWFDINIAPKVPLIITSNKKKNTVKKVSHFIFVNKQAFIFYMAQNKLLHIWMTLTKYT